MQLLKTSSTTEVVCSLLKVRSQCVWLMKIKPQNCKTAFRKIYLNLISGVFGITLAYTVICTYLVTKCSTWKQCSIKMFP